MNGCVAGRLDQPGQVGLLNRRVDVRVPVVLEHTEEPVQADIDARGLDELGRVRVQLHPARLDLRFDVAVGEQHSGNLPRPVRCRLGPAGGGPGQAPGLEAGPRGCSSMAEHQLPKLTVRVRFPSPAPTREPSSGRMTSRLITHRPSRRSSLPRARCVPDRPLLGPLGPLAHPVSDQPCRAPTCGAGRCRAARVELWPIRSISSRRLAPASPASVLPVCRRSWKWKPDRLAAVERLTPELREVAASELGTLGPGEHERVRRLAPV